MAATAIMSQSNGLQLKKKDDINNKDNLWSSILAEVQNSGNNKLPSNKNVLVLGDNESGKTTLIAKLQGVEDPKKGSGLEFAYIDVRDDYRDDQTRLSVWVLDGDPGHANLLRFALNAEKFPHTLVMLVAAMTTPWALLDQLQSWAALLGDHIDKLPLDNDTRQKCRQLNVKKWQDYTEPGDELDPGSPLRRTSRNLDDDADNLPLPEGVLTTNLGLDVVVVITKTDYMSTLEKEHDYKDEHFDFMQQWIRRFCLQYGAGLFYTSAKEDKNCDLLYKYLTHRIYNLPFRTPALVVEKDAVLIPAGWDNIKKICILHENLQSMKPDDYYRDVIAQPSVNRKCVAREVEVVAEDEQAFLARQQATLSGLRDPSRSPTTRNQASTGPYMHVQVPSPNKKLDAKGANATPSGEGVLASFFNSLLYKKTGASPGGPGANTPGSSGSSPIKIDGGPVDKAAMRNDAAAELDRITRAKKLASSDLNSSSEC
ncbi:cytoplasmic dynein 1 light intermediate chain 2 isoform X1 [Microplitis demolitor]|uniref:cytoplasmic dynein 1 light intermediate chain 2 isoform X1 n=1 Tax=Microplitis demolitor TaxID=69319 RepID=UPI0004CD528E|nr:cytoplasmic dynein 1 light intermediate chain 2 isoform X1 [Microplitis demolitor]